MEEHQRSPFDDWTRYEVRLPMFLGLGFLLTSTTSVVLSFMGYVNSVAIPTGILIGCLGVCLIIEAFCKMDYMKCEDAAKYFRSKIVQFQWQEEAKKDMELITLSTNIADDEIENDFHLLMQAVKQQCAISLVNYELAKEGKTLVPDVILPEHFPKPDPRRKSDYISLVKNNSSTFAKNNTFLRSRLGKFQSMPNMNLAEKFLNQISQVSNDTKNDQPELMELLSVASKSDSTGYLAYRSGPPIKKSEDNDLSGAYSTAAESLNLFHSASTSDLGRKCHRIKQSLEKIRSFDGLSKLKSNVLPTILKRYRKELLINKETRDDFSDFLLFQTESVV